MLVQYGDEMPCFGSRFSFLPRIIFLECSYMISYDEIKKILRRLSFYKNIVPFGQHFSSIDFTTCNQSAFNYIVMREDEEDKKKQHDKKKMPLIAIKLLRAK